LRVLSTISAFQIGRDYHDLGYGLDDPAGVGTGNSRNGFATKPGSTGRLWLIVFWLVDDIVDHGV